MQKNGLSGDQSFAFSGISKLTSSPLMLFPEATMLLPSYTSTWTKSEGVAPATQGLTLNRWVSISGVVCSATTWILLTGSNHTVCQITCYRGILNSLRIICLLTDRLRTVVCRVPYADRQNIILRLQSCCNIEWERSIATGVTAYFNIIHPNFRLPVYLLRSSKESVYYSTN